MCDPIGSIARRAALAACLLLTVALPLAAQEPLPGPPPATPEFLSRYNFHLAAAALASDDNRFSWDTRWGGDFDFVDYVKGRMMFLAEYDAVLGNERRLFDPNQGNYILAVSGSWRIRGTEFAGVLHHESRHLADRDKEIAIAWNAFVLRGMRQVNVGKNTLALRFEGGPVIARAFVDYTWTAVGEATLRRTISPHVGVYGRLEGDFWGVDKEVFQRSNQNGGRVEAGFRFGGKGGALELYGGYEKVVDAYQLEPVPKQWAFAGFRIVN